MPIKNIEIEPKRGPGRSIAEVSFVMEMDLLDYGVKGAHIVERADGSLFVGLPSRKMGGDSRMYFVNPIGEKARAAIEGPILAEYEKMTRGIRE